jgi:predicted nucleic-acid-binding Zn-ribbon protein
MSFVKICPKCGSTDIGIPSAGRDLGMSVKDRCRKCDNVGNFFEIEFDKVDEFKEKLKSIV